MSRFSRKYKYDSKIGTEPIIEDCPEWTRIAFNKILEKYLYVDHDDRYRNDENIPIGIKTLHESICKLCRIEMEQVDWDSLYCQENLFYRIKTIEWYYFYDSVEIIANELLEIENNHFFDKDWIEKFGFKKYVSDVNGLLKEDNIIWRLNNKGEFTREIPTILNKTVEDTNNELKDKFEPAREHYKKAINYIYSHPIDVENGIKEIISAIESVGRTIFDSAVTLGDVIKQMRKTDDYPSELITVIEKFYVYTNRSPGVRHGANKMSSLSLDDAELSLHIGVSLIRYLISKDKVRTHNNA